MASRKKNDILLYFMFWLLYIPMSLVIMQFKPVNFTVVMLIGLKIILIYLLFESYSGKKRVIVKKEVQENNAPIPWANVFQENFGKKIIDLD